MMLMMILLMRMEMIVEKRYETTIDDVDEEWMRRNQNESKKQIHARAK